MVVFAVMVGVLPRTMVAGPQANDTGPPPLSLPMKSASLLQSVTRPLAWTGPV